MRTINELAKEALGVQDACNLTGVLHSYSRAMTDLREIARAEGWESTDKLNTHPVAVLYSSKISSLTGDDFAKAYGWALDNAR
jgi:hypothetical protein